MRELFRRAYSLYAASRLHPHLGGLIKRALLLRNRFVAREPFIEDLGPFRMNLDLQQLIDTSIYTMGTWEAKSIATIQLLVPRGGTAVDVGANIGFMTLHMAACVGKEGRVLAFEPSTWAFERLRSNLALNDVPQVVAERVGLSDHAARQDDVSVPYGYPLVGARPVMQDSIVLRTLDGYLADHPVERLDFVKCDTDGWEAHVFRGGEEALRRFRPALLLEVNPAGLQERGQSVTALITQLQGLGYAIYHEGSLQAVTDLEAVAQRLARTGHDLDVVALHASRRTQRPGRG